MNILARIASIPLAGLGWAYYHTLFALAGALSRRRAAPRPGGSSIPSLTPGRIPTTCGGGISSPYGSVKNPRDVAGVSFWLDRPEDMDGDFRKARSQY